MKKTISYSLLVLLSLFMNSCAVAGGIFKAGMLWGIFLVVGLIALILYLISRGRK